MAEPPTYLVTKPSGRVQVSDVLADGSLGDAMTFAVDHPDKAAIARYRTTWAQSGVWAPVLERREMMIEFFDPAGFLSPTDLAAARSLIAADLPHQGVDPPPGIARRDVQQRVLLRSGIWRDALAFGTVALLVNSLRWAPAALTFRRERRRRAGLCIFCGYPLAGLDTRVCPECGEPLPSPAARANVECPARKGRHRLHERDRRG
jgi:hypothetical protein